MRKIFTAVLLLTAAHLSAQRLENIRAEVQSGGEKVIITYDLNGTSQNQKFRISIYSSHNGFSSPLSQVSGDVGRDREVTGGTGKRIEWSAKSELVDFNGDITFEISAEPILATLQAQTPPTLKKGKTATLTWIGGVPGENVRIELLKNGSVVSQIGNPQNNQSYSWGVPKDLVKGSDYQIKLTSGSLTSTSGSFGIKPKTKILYIIIPAAVVVGGVVFLLTKGGGGKKKDLPAPPDPTDP